MFSENTGWRFFGAQHSIFVNPKTVDSIFLISRNLQVTFYFRKSEADKGLSNIYSNTIHWVPLILKKSPLLAGMTRLMLGKRCRISHRRSTSTSNVSRGSEKSQRNQRQLFTNLPVHAQLCRQNKSIRVKRKLRFAIRLHSPLSVFSCLLAVSTHTRGYSVQFQALLKNYGKWKRAKFHPEFMFRIFENH